MNHPQKPAFIQREPPVSTEACAAYFGICVVHLRRLAHAGVVPYLKTSSPGGRVHFRFRIAEVEKALEVKKSA